MADGASPDFEGVLELRIHGVNNTSPASMLDLPTDSIERVVGDDLASFWREKEGTQQALRRGDRGWRPRGLTREAYSWGGLARNTPDVPGGGALSTIGRGLARVGWALLLPFGIANVAYWTRRLDVGTREGSDVTRGRGAGSARLFGLGLTVLTIVTWCELAMDLVATQCYRGQTAQCAKLPSPFDVLAGREAALRLVMAALAPLALLLVLYLLSSVTRSYYERCSSPAYDELGAEEARSSALLAAPGFWSGETMVGRLVRLHLTAGVAVVTLAMAWPAAFGGGEACRSASALVDGDCWDQVFRRDRTVHGALVLAVLLALLLLLASAASTCRRATDAPDVSGGGTGRDLTPWLLGMALAALLLTGALLAFGKPAIDDSSSLLGVSAAPTLTVSVLAALAISGVLWRLDRGGPLWAIPLAGGLVAAAFWSWSVVVFGALVLLLVVRALSPRRVVAGERAHVAWRGFGPGVLLGLSLMAAMTLASAVALVAGDWLNGKYPASDLIRPSDTVVRATGGAKDPRLLVASPYVLFGAATVVALLLLAVLLGAVLIRTTVGYDPPPVVAPRREQSSRLAIALVRARRLACGAHRAERVLAMLVLLGAVSVTLVLTLAVEGWPDGPLAKVGGAGFLRKLIDFSTVGVAVVGAAVLAALVGGKSTGSSRPLGLIWDLVCFLPRAAHPFGPPCYAERAVPEIVGRCDWWLHTEHMRSQGPKRRGDRIVLSAHSLGAVLAVAAVLALPTNTVLRQSRSRQAPPPMRLLTYGCQLRAYFGRIFPELLGPDVLGTPPVPSARLWSRDPWGPERTTPVPAGFRGAGTVVALLGGKEGVRPRWRNLWRATDFLGFPVQGFTVADNDIDLPAEETDATGYLVEIGTHSMYQRVPAYEHALDELVPERVRRRWREKASRQPGC